MPRLNVVATCLALACLAGCSPSSGKPAPEPEEAIDANDPLYAVALGRSAETLYGTRGDILVARKSKGRFFLDSVPYREDFSFRPGQQVPADPVEAARLREFRIRELTTGEWDALRKIVAGKKLLERDPAAAGTRDLKLKILVCGAKSVLLGWGPSTGYDGHGEELIRVLRSYATVNGQPWIAPEEPLPADAVDKILVVSVGESHFGVGGGGSAWSLEASRDKDGVWISSRFESKRMLDGSEDDLQGHEDVVTGPTRHPLTEEEWKDLLEFIRREDLLHWRPRMIRALDGGDSYVTIRTVVDFNFHWSLGLNEDAKAARLEAHLRRLYERHETKNPPEPK